jgi:hypothetical protein
LQTPNAGIVFAFLIKFRTIVLNRERVMWIIIGAIALPIAASLLFQLLQVINLVPDSNEDFIFIAAAELAEQQADAAARNNVFVAAVNIQVPVKEF